MLLLLLLPTGPRCPSWLTACATNCINGAYLSHPSHKNRKSVHISGARHALVDEGLGGALAGEGAAAARKVRCAAELALGVQVSCNLRSRFRMAGDKVAAVINMCIGSTSTSSSGSISSTASTFAPSATAI